MGTLHYGDTEHVVFDDRTLTHLRTVILSKLSIGESMVFTWSTEGSQHSLWLHPAVSLRFDFDSAVTPELNMAWLEQLRSLANSPGGLRLVSEPPAPNAA